MHLTANIHYILKILQNEKKIAARTWINRFSQLFFTHILINTEKTRKIINFNVNVCFQTVSRKMGFLNDALAYSSPIFFFFQCPIELFHYGCVGLSQTPKGKWFFKRCTCLQFSNYFYFQCPIEWFHYGCHKLQKENVFLNDALAYSSPIIFIFSVLSNGSTMVVWGCHKLRKENGFVLSVPRP